MKIGNVISTDEINIGQEFNILPEFDKFSNLPTLIVGYEEAKELYGDKVSTLNYEIDKNIFWTFKKNVRRNVYELSIEDFIRYSYNKLVNKINYIDVDIIQFSPSKLIKIIKKIKSLDKIISYKTDNQIIYMFTGEYIFGVDLNTMSYAGIDTTKLEQKIKQKSMVFLSGSEILIEYKNHLERLNDDLKYLPFLYSVNTYD